MAYRGDESGAAIEAPTAEGTLRAEFGPRSLRLEVAGRTLQIVDRFVTFVDAKHKKRTLKLPAGLVLARDVPRDDLGLWMELTDQRLAGVRRIFGVEPVSLLDERGLPALAVLDRLALRMRSALGELSVETRRGIEMGRGLDKVLLVDHPDRTVLYARRLFRDRARFLMAIRRDGRIEILDDVAVREIVVRSRFGITVLGDYLRFTNAQGDDLARVAVPWIDRELRWELARRIGQLVDASDSSGRAP